MRIGIIAIQHESNTFLDSRTSLDDFRADRLLVGEEIRRSQEQAHHEVGGFFEGLSRRGDPIEAVPLLMAVAMPSGIVAADAVSRLLDMMNAALDEAGHLDGMLVAPHGAAVSEEYPDMDGYWLGQLRERVGAAMPVIGTLDLHANVSRQMVRATDGLIAYRTNPHLDQRARGIEAARLMIRTVRGEIRPTQALAMPPIAISMERQLTLEEPCTSLFARADAQRAGETAERSTFNERPAVLSNSVILGFPYADVAEMGSSFIVVTDNNPGLAQQLADQLATELWDRRHDFVAHLIGVDEALDMAARSAKPVCLLDMGDNIGGGSAADGTVIAEALMQRGDLQGFVSICDPESVQHIVAVSPEEARSEIALHPESADAIAPDSQNDWRSCIGRRFRLRIGGKTDARHGAPLAADGLVTRITDGRFSEPQSRHGGRTEYDMGPTAIVTTESGLTIQLTSRRIAPFSLRQLTSCGIDPKAFDVIVAKGVHAPVAAYASVCATFIRVNTPGVTSVELGRFEYHQRRRPLYPFEDAA